MKNILTILTFTILPFTSFAQLDINLSLIGGGSKLIHQSNFETTEFASLYKFVAVSNGGINSYSYNTFLTQYDIKKYVISPRAGVKLKVTSRSLPIVFESELTSSPSTITAPRLGLTVGIGNSFFINSWGSFDFMCGLKYVKDWGWGDNTILNSIYNKDARNFARNFFVSENGLGKNSALMMNLNANVSYYILQKFKIGIEPFFEVDITDYTKKPSRMTNYGANLVLSMKIK